MIRLTNVKTGYDVFYIDLSCQLWKISLPDDNSICNNERLKI